MSSSEETIMNSNASAQKNRELLQLMRRIDKGYIPTEQEKLELSKTTEINFSSFSLDTLPNCWNLLVSLCSLNVSDNNLQELPNCICQLTTLQSLDVSNNYLTVLPDNIGQLTALEFLDVGSDINILNLRGNSITTLPNSIGQLTMLRSLNVGGNKLSMLPDSIAQLSELRSLNLSSNNLTSLPDSIGQLTSLESLDLSANHLSILPNSIGQLTNLKSLSVFLNRLSTLPDSIGHLTLLGFLNARNNRLKVLPDCIEQLVSLQILRVSYNNLAEFPAMLTRINHLTVLDISHNHIRCIPPQISKLSKLENLYLSGLQLHHLPATIMDLKLPFVSNTRTNMHRNGIHLQDTSLSTQPISLFMQPRELIQTYFNMEQVPINEGKVIFLGHGDVGKTYIIQRILNYDKQGNYETQMTPGISISYLPVERNNQRFSICFWDFGGQEIMHAMHRCFLTNRTCYVIIVSNRLPDLDGQARYWLRNIESFASGSDVLLVVNRWENYPSNEDINYNQLIADFPNLVGYVSVSAKCDNKQTFHKLTERIIEMAATLDSTGMNFPIQWYNIRQSLMKMAEDGKYYINKDDYYQICKDNHLTDKNIRMWLLEWFNDLGTCFSYHQGTDNKELETYKVLNPEWITNAIYIIILNGKKFTNNGIITHNVIEILLSNPTGGTLSGVTYTSEECEYVLEVMRKFTLSYSVSDTDEFIPALCPNETPEVLYPTDDLESTGYTKHLTYELEYTYLPDSVVHQLMIYCYQYLRLDRCWRKGLSLDIRGMELSAIVNMGSSDQLLSIDVYSYGNCPLWLLLQPLLDAIRRINEKLNLKAFDYVYAETVSDGRTFTDRYTIDYILSVKNGSPQREPRNILQGKEIDHSIPDLLFDLYGEQNLTDATHDIQAQSTNSLTQPTLANATLNNCMLVFGNSNSVSATSYQGISEAILKIILKHEEKTTDMFLNELARIFAQQNHDETQKLGKAMQSAQKEHKSAFKIFRERLDDSEKLASIAANLYIAMPAITVALQKAPELVNMLSDLLVKFPHYPIAF